MIVAGGTVVISLLGLMFMGVSFLYGVAISASLAVLVVVVASVTLLPALLAFAGRRVDRLRIPGLGRSLRTGERHARHALEPAGPAPGRDRRRDAARPC